MPEPAIRFSDGFDKLFSKSRMLVHKIGDGAAFFIVYRTCDGQVGGGDDQGVPAPQHRSGKVGQLVLATVNGAGDVFEK